MTYPWLWLVPILVAFWLFQDARQDPSPTVVAHQDAPTLSTPSAESAPAISPSPTAAPQRQSTGLATQLVGETNVQAMDAWNASIDKAGNLYTAFYPTRHSLMLAGAAGPQPIVDPGADAEDAPSGLAMAGDAQGAWIAYRNKHPVRDIYLTHTRDLETQLGISGDSAALARLQMAVADQGVRVLWYGERGLMGESDDPQPYMVYYNHVRDGQADEPQAVLPGIYPVWINDAQGGVMVFSWYPAEASTQGFRVGMRYSADGQVFGPEVVLSDTPEISLPFAAFESKGRYFVYWVALHGEHKSDFLIEGFYSDDQGQSWEGFAFEGLRGMDVAKIDHAVDGNGQIALLVIGDYRHTRIEKQRPFLITSSDNGSSWSEPRSLRGEEFDYARAPNAKAIFLNNGELFLLVEDWRSIRAELRYWVSADLGTSWRIEGAALNLDPAYNYQLAHAVQSVYPTQDGRLHLAFERSQDAFLSKDILTLTLEQSRLGHRSLHKPPERPDEKRLQARVAKYAQALIDKDYQAAYDLMDPFYRARVDFLGHLQSQGRIQYREAEFAEMVRFGNLAFVGIRMIASVPRFTMGGRDIEVPEREMVTPTRWLWVDGDWYMEMYSEAQELSFARY